MNKTISAALALIIIGLLGGIYIYTNNGNDSVQTTGQSQTETKTGGSVVDYSGKGLTKFPKEVLSKTEITALNLSNNNLTGALPAEIRKLSILEELNVSNNQMTGIPAEIGQLKNLKILILIKLLKLKILKV